MSLDLTNVARHLAERDPDIHATALVPWGQGDQVAVPEGVRTPSPTTDPALPDLRSRLVTGGAFVLDAPDTIPAVWGTGDQVFWASGESLFLVGPAGVGKTTMVCQLVAGRLGLLFDSILGLPIVPAERKVLYLASDRPRQIQRAMRRLFDESHRALLEERLIVWQGPPPADLAANPDLLVRMATEAGADTVILDSLKDMAIGLSEDAVGAGLNSAIQRTLVEGIEVTGLHHQRKGGHGDKPKALADVYGSTWITAGAGSVVLLWGEPGDLIVELTHLKQPAAAIGPYKIEHDHVRGISTVANGFDLLHHLRQHPDGVTAIEAARIQYESATPTENQRRKAQRALDALVGKELARRVEGSRGGAGGARAATYYSTDNLTLTVAS